MTLEKLEDKIIIDTRWEMYSDGVVYDTKRAKDIPQWIFDFRDFCLENYEEMEWQIK